MSAIIGSGIQPNCHAVMHFAKSALPLLKLVQPLVTWGTSDVIACLNDNDSAVSTPVFRWPLYGLADTIEVIS